MANALQENLPILNENQTRKRPRLKKISFDSSTLSEPRPGKVRKLAGGFSHCVAAGGLISCQIIRVYGQCLPLMSGPG